MAAGRSALAVVLLACAAPLLLLPATGSGGVRADDDFERPALQLCSLEHCACTVQDPDGLQITVRCTYTGHKLVTWKSDLNGSKPEHAGKRVVDVELIGDGHCNLTVRCPNRKTFGTFAWLRSFNVTGFAEVTIEPQGLQIKNASSRFAVTVSKVGQLFLDTNAVQPQSGRADVLIEDCRYVRLNGGVVGNLRSFAFRRIGRLELAENTFKLAAAQGSAIERMILEDLTAEKLPSHAFITTIDMLSITNCTFGTIERHAFPINTMINVTLTNVTVNRMKTEAFQSSLIITNLRMTGCSVREMETNAVMSAVQSIHIERSKFGSVQTSAVSVYNELVLNNNTFERVASHGFLLNNPFSVQVDGNVFRRLDADAFYEPSAVGQQQTRLELRFSYNVFGTTAERSQPAATAAAVADEPAWLPVVRLQKTAVRTNVTDNLVSVPCGCGPWRFVAVTDGGENGTELDDGNDDAEFADRNRCRADVPGAAECANLTVTAADGGRREWEPIDGFRTAAGCDRDAGAFEICVRERAAKLTGGTGFGFLGDALTPNVERGVITTVVLLILCGFGCVCAVSAVTWLNARGYFIKLRSLLTSDRGGRTGFDGGSSSGGGMSRTMSAHSLSPMPVHEYAELQRHKHKLSGSSGGSSELGVLVVVYQDRGTQTVPEELTPEMLQSLRDKLEVPEDYAEARGMIEHLYDLIRVEETCCGSGNTGGSSRGLEDMTSTITTRAVSVGRRNGAERRDVRSIGTGAPSLERLWPPKLMNAAVAADWQRYNRPSPPRHRQQAVQPPVGEYMDPVDLYDGGSIADDGTELYCELADLRDDGPSPKPKPVTQPCSLAQPRPPPPQSRPPPPPPPSRISTNSTKV